MGFLRLRLGSCALGLALAAWGAAPAAPVAGATRDALDNAIQAESQVFPGGFGAILFTGRGEAWSYPRSPTGRTIPFDRDTPLMVGELSGRCVILAAVLLAQRGALDLERPATAYLPELAAKDAAPSLRELGQLSVRTLAAEATGRVDETNCRLPS